ncbi:MAG: glycosyltransferase [Gammaproteobacteria bacterium]|nr:glycosyltransferase [Gammaproteobacteria bacterium]
MANKQSEDDDVTEVSKSKYLLNKVFLYANRLFRKCVEKNHEPEYYFEHSNINFYSGRELLKKMPFKPDVIIVGWVDGFITPKILHDLSRVINVPIIWYLMDMAPLTGGCHFSWGCIKYMDGCGGCPAIESGHENDASRKNILVKQNLMEKTNLVVVSATEWLDKQAKKSSVFKGKNILKIMLGVDKEIFSPTSRVGARMSLNLPLDSKVLFVGATSLSFKRKGVAYLYQALELLDKKIDVRKKKILILSAGSGDGEEVRGRISKNFQHVHLGYLKNDCSLALAYQASNLYVCPSIEDSGPMMINESMMCGTPVVSFEMGGAFDLVHTGITGYRASLKNNEDLATGIAYILALPEEDEREMVRQCRKIALKYCSPKAQVDSFNRLFAEIVK